jgi:hypothetical protein
MWEVWYLDFSTSPGASPSSDVLLQLNDMGANRWELVQVVQVSSGPSVQKWRALWLPKQAIEYEQKKHGRLVDVTLEAPLAETKRN